MQIRKDLITVSIAVFIVIIVIGEVGLYGLNIHHCSVNVEREGDVAEYSFDTDLKLTYTVVSLDNSSNKAKEVVAFYDDDYSSAYTPDAKHYLELLQKALSKASINLRFVDIDGLSDIVNSSRTDVAVVFATETFPYSVYSGHGSDPIFSWLRDGGYIYWLYGAIGARYFDSEGVNHYVGEHDELFFGNSSVTRCEGGMEFDDTFVEGSFTQITHQYYNNCTNGINVDRLVSDYVCTDYNFSGYHSLVFNRYYGGTGTLCVFGGSLATYMVGQDTAIIVAQTIASGTTYDTVMVDHYIGTNCHHAKGTVRCATEPTDIFIFLGDGDLTFASNTRI